MWGEGYLRARDFDFRRLAFSADGRSSEVAETVISFTAKAPGARLLAKIPPGEIVSLPGNVMAECYVDGARKAPERDDAGAPSAGCRISDPISVLRAMVIYADYGARGVLNDSVCAADALC